MLFATSVVVFIVAWIISMLVITLIITLFTMIINGSREVKLVVSLRTISLISAVIALIVAILMYGHLDEVIGQIPI